MTDAESSGTDAVLRRLSRRALRSNLARIEKLEAALETAAAAGLTEQERRKAIEAAHQILGSAGTFGYPGASAVAGDLEQLLRSNDLGDRTAYAQAHELLAAVRSELASAPGS